MKILVTDGMDKTALEQLKKNGHEVVEQFYAPEELGAALKDFDAVVVRSATKVRASHIDEAKGGRLKLIIRGGGFFLFAAPGPARPRTPRLLLPRGKSRQKRA